MWRKFPKNKPKKNGWYICTVEVPNQQRYVMMLYWYGERGESGRFIDNNRQYVFDIYSVYGYSGSKLTTCNLCDRTNSVVAFRKPPKSYMKGFKKNEL